MIVLMAVLWFQTEVPIAQAFDWLARGGVVSILAAIVVGALREWWVPGSVYKRMEADRDAWKDYALRILNTTDRAVTLVEKDNLP